MKINWASKFGSRKFLTTLAGLVIAILILFGAPQDVIVKATAVLGSFITLIVYLFVQGSIDGQPPVEPPVVVPPVDTPNQG